MTSSLFYVNSALERKLKTAILALLLVSLSAFAEPYSARVIGIKDGDTITVLDASKTQHVIRLMGIDAPEKKQAYGSKAKETLSDLIYGQDVLVDTKKLDRYGREIGKITVAGRDANLAMISAGMAWHYKQYEREQLVLDRVTYAEAEIDARRDRLGLWRDAEPVAPWEWRHAKRQ